MRERTGRHLKKRLLQTRGETLAETLMAILIVALAFVMLAGGIAATARVNRGTRDLRKNVTEGTPVAGYHVTIIHEPGTPGERGNTVPGCVGYETEAGYIYYEVTP